MLPPHVGRLLGVLDNEMSPEQLMQAMRIHDRNHFRESSLKLALEQELVEMTQPDKPRSVLQRYRLTPLVQAAKQQGTFKNELEFSTALWAGAKLGKKNLRSCGQANWPRVANCS